MTAHISVVISTRNRCNDVLVAIESCLAQSDCDFEILLYDDASTDGTVPAVRERFPEVRLHASESRAGYLVWRNCAFREAQGKIIVSIDDDAYFTAADTLSRVGELFTCYPEAGAFALPFVEPPRDLPAARMADLPVGTPLRSYTGCAHAVRRDVALRLGGYPEHLIHQGEERDLCLRMLDAGFSTLYADTPPIVHCFSPQRDPERVAYYGFRNTLLFTGMHAPQPYMLPRMAIDSLQLLTHRFRWRTLPWRCQAILAGWCGVWKSRARRHAVSRSAYATFRRRPGHGPLPCEVVPPPLARNPMECKSF